jgi:uncharacterized protein YcbX
MPHVVALYRYPVKGFTPEECDILTVLDEGRIEDDRVLGLRFADVVERVATNIGDKTAGMIELLKKLMGG